jgi:hypothetical protein
MSVAQQQQHEQLRVQKRRQESLRACSVGLFLLAAAALCVSWELLPAGITKVNTICCHACIAHICRIPWLQLVSGVVRSGPPARCCIFAATYAVSEINQGKCTRSCWGSMAALARSSGLRRSYTCLQACSSSARVWGTFSALGPGAISSHQR